MMLIKRIYNNTISPDIHVYIAVLYQGADAIVSKLKD